MSPLDSDFGNAKQRIRAKRAEVPTAKKWKIVKSESENDDNYYFFNFFLHVFNLAFFCARKGTY